MSRIGRSPIVVDKTVQISVSPDNEVTVKGAKSTEKVKMRREIKAQLNGQELVLTRSDENKDTKALHGLYRALLQNAVTGVTKGFSKSLELVGVGYRAGVKGKQLEMTLGFSHPILFDIPAGIEIKVDKQTLVTISGSNRALVGEVAAKLRGYKPPEPYLGKGVKYQNEVIRKKAGKAAGK